MNIGLYSLRARTLPILILAVPLYVSLWALYPGALTLVETMGSAFAIGAAAFLLSQIGRDQGKKLQPEMWQLWGGSPTTVLLRHTNNPNPTLLARRHKKISDITGVVLPSAAEETTNPSAADEAYDTAVTALRNLTRDRKRFPLVYQENVNYGFRRNLVGMRPTGIALSLLSTVACIAYPVIRGGAPTTAEVVATVVSAVFAALWILRFRIAWVQPVAFDYANRIFEAADDLPRIHGQESH